MAKNKIITVQDVPITVSVSDEQDYICITDMAAAARNWTRPASRIRPAKTPTIWCSTPSMPIRSIGAMCGERSVLY